MKRVSSSMFSPDVIFALLLEGAWMSLHSAEPRDGAVTEVSYGGYARQLCGGPRTRREAQFPACTEGSAAVTHFGLHPTIDGPLIYYSTVTPVVTIDSGVTPSISINIDSAVLPEVRLSGLRTDHAIAHVRIMEIEKQMFSPSTDLAQEFIKAQSRLSDLERLGVAHPDLPAHWSSEVRVRVLDSAIDVLRRHVTAVRTALSATIPRADVDVAHDALLEGRLDVVTSLLASGKP